MTKLLTFTWPPSDFRVHKNICIVSFTRSSANTDKRRDAFSQYAIFFSSNCAFLPHDVMRKRGLCCGPVSVHLSVRLSVCLSRSCINQEGWRYRQTSLSTWYPHHSSFLDPRRRYPIPRGNSFSGAQNTRGGKILRFSTEIAVYLGNGMR